MKNVLTKKLVVKLLPYLQADEQWQLHWKDIVLDGDDSVFTE